MSDALWRCPRCRGALEYSAARVRCVECGEAHDIVTGIPDLRAGGPAWVDRERDLEDARRLARDFAGRSPDEMVRAVFRARPEWDEAMVAQRARQVTEHPGRLAAELGGWLRESTAEDGFLDVGCGAGTLLAAAATVGRRGIGVDVSMVWLVVARRMIERHGGTPVLAAAYAGALPLANGAVPGVVLLDVVEHVADQARCLREADRVLRPGGALALATPNRFSLAREPHVFVWGVGWLPRRWQRPYAEWRSGRSYASTRLLSVRETARLFARHTTVEPRFLVPAVPQSEIQSFPSFRARLARVYNRLAGHRSLERALLAVGPFFRVIATKPADGPRTV